MSTTKILAPISFAICRAAVTISANVASRPGSNRKNRKSSRPRTPMRFSSSVNVVRSSVRTTTGDFTVVRPMNGTPSSTRASM